MQKPVKIVCFGPGPRFKGGISNYNTSLAKAFDAFEHAEVHIVSWTQQYPALIPREFVDTKSKADLLEGTRIQVHYLTNYNNPFSWGKTVRFIAALRPDIVIFQWAISVQGLPMGWMARRLRRHPGIEILFDIHNIVQKENSALDKILTRYGIGKAHHYIVHSLMTYSEMCSFLPDRAFALSEDGHRQLGRTTVIKLYHPIYDIFRPDPGFDVEGFRQQLGLRRHVFLFFGFIRKYKGLHDAIRAFRLVADRRDDVSLLICGESFWNTADNRRWTTRLKRGLFNLLTRLLLRQSDNEQDYRPLELIDTLGLNDRVVVVNDFIPNEAVHQYFQVSDALLLFYSYATPSGVESLAYNFRLPVVATRVGAFIESVRDGFNGYLAEPGDHADMARQMLRILDSPIPRENVAARAAEMSWQHYAEAILNR